MTTLFYKCVVISSFSSLSTKYYSNMAIQGSLVNISVLLSPFCVANPFKTREFCLCLNVSWCVPAGLTGKQSTHMLKAGRQEAAGESRVHNGLNAKRWDLELQVLGSGPAARATPNPCSQVLQQAAMYGPTANRTQEQNIEGCAKRGCFMLNGYVDEWALPHSLG